MRLKRVDLFFLHNQICPDDYVYTDVAVRREAVATTWSLYRDAVPQGCERLTERRSRQPTIR